MVQLANRHNADLWQKFRRQKICLYGPSVCNNSDFFNTTKTMTENKQKIEEPYYDEKGREIKEFAVIKVRHFLGVNEQGRGRKRYYMYKWVKLKEYKGKKYWVAMHLNNDIGDSYYLRTVADRQTRVIKGTEIAQQY